MRCRGCGCGSSCICSGHKSTPCGTASLGSFSTGLRRLSARIKLQQLPGLRAIRPALFLACCIHEDQYEGPVRIKGLPTTQEEVLSSLPPFTPDLAPPDRVGGWQLRVNNGNVANGVHQARSFAFPSAVPQVARTSFLVPVRSPPMGQRQQRRFERLR
jgi:hypothetical protein